MEQSLGKLTDAEIIADYKNAEIKYGSTNITDAEIIASYKIHSSRYGRYMFYSPEENLFAASYPLKGELKILGWYKTFEEAEDRVCDLFKEITDKVEKEITENEHFIGKSI
jgi:hypothetical protein